MDPTQPYGAEAEVGNGDGFTVASNEAYVASAIITCAECQTKTEVICIHCASGTAYGEPLTQFTLSDVSAIDEALAEQLAPWPAFRKVGAARPRAESDPDSGESLYANHCSSCGAVQDDLYLHSEPDEPFFDIPSAAPGALKLTPLIGLIRLTGDEHFEID